MIPIHEFRSPTTDRVIWTCDTCGSFHHQPETAESCCRCRECGAAGKGKFRLICKPCEDAEWAAKAAARDAKEWAAPVDDKYDGPVYADGKFYDGRWDAADAAECDGIDPATVLANPCHVRKAHTADLLDTVEEAWADEFDDREFGQACSVVRAALAIAQKVAEENAPTVWIPDMTRRIALKPVGEEIARP